MHPSSINYEWYDLRMPPAGLPPKQRPGYSRTTGFLIRAKVLLDLIIGDLFRFILVLFLFAFIFAVAWAALGYRTWLPKAESYLSEYSGFFTDSATTSEQTSATQ